MLKQNTADFQNFLPNKITAFSLRTLQKSATKTGIKEKIGRGVSCLNYALLQVSQRSRILRVYKFLAASPRGSLRHSTPLECYVFGIPMSIDISHLWREATLDRSRGDSSLLQRSNISITQVATNKFCTFQEGFSSLSSPRRGDMSIERCI